MMKALVAAPSREKGGKRHKMPAHHKLEQFLDDYIAAAGMYANGRSPLFRSAIGLI
jgi:integrase/recombinase XerD